MSNLLHTLLTNLANISNIRTDTAFLCDLVSLRMKTQKSSEITMDIKYEQQDQTLKITDSMGNTGKNIAEEFFSLNSSKISALESFKYTDSDMTYEKSEGISYKPNKEVKGTEISIKLSAAASEGISGAAIKELLEKSILAPKNGKTNITYMDIDTENKKENTSKLNLFEFHANISEMGEYLKKCGKISDIIDTIEVKVPAFDNEGNKIEAVTHIFIKNKNPFAAMFGSMNMDYVYFNSMKYDTGLKMPLFKDMDVVSKIEGGQSINIEQYKKDVIKESCKLLSGKSLETLKILQEEVAMTLMRTKMTKDPFANTIQNLLVIAYFEGGERKEAKFEEFMKKYSETATPNLFVTHKEVDGQHPLLEGVSEPVVIIESVVHEQIFMNTSTETFKIDSLFSKEHAYKTELTENQEYCKKLVSFFVGEQVEFTDRLVKNEGCLMRREKFSSVLLNLINPIQNSVSMLYKGSVVFEISSINSKVTELVNKVKENRKEVVLYFIDLFVKSVFLSDPELKRSYAELIDLKSPELLEKRLVEFDEFIKKQKEMEEKRLEEDRKKSEEAAKGEVEDEKADL